MNEITEWIKTLTPLAIAIIPKFLERTKSSNKRAEKILEIIKPEIINQIEKFHNNENLNEHDLINYFNCRKILNDAFLDLETDNKLKQQLLNFELNKILNGKEVYKYIYNKITTKDLEFLQTIGNSWFLISSNFNFVDKPVTFIPTYALLDSKNITFENSVKKSNNYMIQEHFFNTFKYNNEVDYILNMFDKYQNSIFSLINLGLITYKMEDNIIRSTDIIKFSNIEPFALSLTNKGKEIYTIIMNK